MPHCRARWLVGALLGCAGGSAQPGQPTPANEGFVTGADEVRLFYRTVGIRGDTVIFLHGGPGENFQGVGPDLEPLAQRHVLLFYDQRGSGRSETPSDTTLVTAERHVADLEAVRRQFNLDRVTLIGHSWGCGLAALYAAAHPDVVQRLLLIAPLPPARIPFFAARLAAVAKRDSALRVALGWGADDELSGMDAEARCHRRRLFSDLRYYADSAAIRRKRGDYCAVPPRAYQAQQLTQRRTLASLGDWDFRPLLDSISVPSLIVEGALTPLPLDAVVIWAALIPQARLLLVPGAGHGYPFVEQPGLFFPAVERFLNGGWPAGAETVR
jgi:proline iminopeptidase